MYLLDWDGAGSRAETIEVRDAVSGTLLDTRSVASFSNGAYVVWTVTGHVTFKIISTGYANAVVSGLFVD